jgi:hypothetical protein
MKNVITISLFTIVAIGLIVFLIWKNNKDKKLLNPDAQDAVEEAIGDQERRNDET